MKPQALRPRSMHVSNVHTPHGFGAMQMSPEQRDAVQRIALETFTDMANSGKTFAESLAAVYMSGIMHALEDDFRAGEMEANPPVRPEDIR